MGLIKNVTQNLHYYYTIHTRDVRLGANLIEKFKKKKGAAPSDEEMQRMLDKKRSDYFEGVGEATIKGNPAALARKVALCQSANLKLKLGTGGKLQPHDDFRQLWNPACRSTE